LKNKALSTHRLSYRQHGIPPSIRPGLAQWPVIDNTAIKRLAKRKSPSSRGI
jgi:hypothetical protein